MEMEQRTDRRSHVRRKSQVNKTLFAELEIDEGKAQVPIFLVDISTGGMRIHLDRPLEVGSRLGLGVPVSAFGVGLDRLEVQSRVVWQRFLHGGTWVHGLEFVEPSEEAKDCIDRLYTAFSKEGRRTNFRPTSLLGVAYHLGQEWGRQAVYKLSLDGLELQMRDPLPLGSLIPFRLFLDDGQTDPVEVLGEPNLILDLDNGLHQVWVEFREFHGEPFMRLQNYIDQSTQ